MIATVADARDRIDEYARSGRLAPLLIQGDALHVLRSCPAGIFDFAMTSPPYWGKREYHNGGIGLADAVRSNPKKAKVVNGSVISATGVSGVRYKRQIELTTALTHAERIAAMAELEEMLGAVVRGEIADFRMIIRGQQRTTHSDSEKVSGRAKELGNKGFYFLKYHPNGSKPSDVWDILPEDTQKRGDHFAPYPEDLCKIPILATCPPNGMVLDPFCGTGTTMLVASQFGRRSVGIDLAPEYLELAERRCAILL